MLATLVQRNWVHLLLRAFGGAAAGGRAPAFALVVEGGGSRPPGLPPSVPLTARRDPGPDDHGYWWAVSRGL
ncbi:MAG TPA: hypothetical protein VII06_27560 [Chloroflexota bacterium]|jgi:hypothetical protein